ncbi:divergent polysaccharide deacetylase family protein [uncultured Sneathiella sp.]|uniref:divergent polysaccharide deacetylase family protein n=1 Tax=uncultured Sneathiella sp. TaxID=879315 RepID=UPI0030DA6A17
MGNLINDQKTKPAPKNRVSVLFIVSLAVILAIIGVTSWSYFSKPDLTKAPIATASTEINATIEIPAAPADVVQEPELPKPQAELSETTDPQGTPEEAPLPEVEPQPEAVPDTAPPALEEIAEEPVPGITMDTPAPDDPPDSSPSALSEHLGQEEPKTPLSPPNVGPPADKSIQKDDTTPFTPIPEDTALPERPSNTPEEMASVKEQSTLADESNMSASVETEAVPAEMRPGKTPSEQLPQVVKPELQNTALADETTAEEPKTPLQEFAVKFDISDKRPRIAIILSDAGISAAHTREAIEVLPAAVTFAINPYGSNLQNFVDQARKKGHEILLQLPMEPKGYPRIDPGAKALRTDLEESENLERLEWVLDRITGYVGLTNQMGSKFTTEPAAITPVLKVIKEKGLLYLDSRTASDSVAADIAIGLEIPVAINNRFLDHKADGDIIDARLEDLEYIARQAGFSVGIAYPHTETFQHIIDWASTLDKKGFALVPVSALIKKQEIE